MRKCIKGSLELNGIDYTNTKVDFFDVAHLISPIEEDEIKEIKENKAPVVVSALYTEDDPDACFLEYDREKKLSLLSSKGLKFLQKVDLILVPCESAKELLINNGVTTPINVVSAGVNLSRFDFTKETEKSLFYRYYGENPNKKLVIAVGEYNPKMEGITSFVNAAKKCPNAMFYYIGRLTLKTRVNMKFRTLKHSLPKNVKFVDVPPDDIYRSALLNASIFMIPGYKKAGVTSIVEAMAAKTQIIARRSAIFDGLLEDGVTAHMGEFSETLASLTRDYLEGKIKPTILQAYNEVTSHTLEVLGEELIKEYQFAINKMNRSDLK